MSLRLYRAAHHTEGRVGRTIPGDKARNDRMERAFAAADQVRMTGLQRESGTAVLQADAGSRHDNAGTEAHVVRLNQRHHHPTLVSCSEVDGATRRRRAVTEVLRTGAVDQTCSRGEIAAIEQL